MPNFDKMKSLTDAVEYWFAFIFAGGSLGGLAALLRAGAALTCRTVVGAMLNSGLLALVIAFVLWKKYEGDGNLLFLAGVSIFAGLGGTTSYDFIKVYISKKLNIDITTHDDRMQNRADKKTEADDRELDSR